jgi:hypothetical protein
MIDVNLPTLNEAGSMFKVTGAVKETVRTVRDMSRVLAG